MQILEAIKKHIFIELFNKLLIFIFPFAAPLFLKAFFGRHRIGKHLHVYTPLTLINTNSKNLSIGNNCHIGRNVTLDTHEKISLGDNVTISMNCTLITHFDAGSSTVKKCGYKPTKGPIKIGEGSCIGANTTILEGVKIGKNCLIGANSLVISDIPDNSLALGSPAKVIKSIKEQ